MFLLMSPFFNKYLCLIQLLYELMLCLRIFSQAGPQRWVNSSASPSVCHLEMKKFRWVHFKITQQAKFPVFFHSISFVLSVRHEAMNTVFDVFDMIWCGNRIQVYQLQSGRSSCNIALSACVQDEKIWRNVAIQFYRLSRFQASLTLA